MRGILHISIIYLQKTNDSFLTVARITYQASDVIVSVQPSLAVDSEFSSHLKRYYGRKERSLVAKNVESVPEVRNSPKPSPYACISICLLMLTWTAIAPLHKIQCRPVAVCLRARPEWPSRLGHHLLQDPPALGWPSLQAGQLSRRHPRCPPPGQLPRLLRHNVD